MRDDEDEGVGALDGLGQVGLGDDVVAKVDAREVLDVLVLLVDDLGQLAALELRRREGCSSQSSCRTRPGREPVATHVLLVAPHLDLGVELVRALLDVLADEARNRRAPVAAPCEACATVRVSSTRSGSEMPTSCA